METSHGWWNSTDVLWRMGTGGYATVDFDIRRYQELSSRHNLVATSLVTLQSGGTDVVPTYLDFSLGGSNSVRGWDFNSRRGKNQFINSLEYRYTALETRPFRVLGISLYAGLALAVFGDAGTAWTESDGFSDGFIAGGGVGLRLFIPFVSMIRLDFAMGDGNATHAFRDQREGRRAATPRAVARQRCRFRIVAPRLCCVSWPLSGFFRRILMRRTIAGAMVALACGVAASGVAAQTKVIPGEMEKVTATVEAVDHGTRTVTLKLADGTFETIVAPASVQRFNAIKVGDTLQATYYDNIVVRVKQPGEKDVDTAGEALTRTPGTSPGVTAAAQRTITATITAIDPKDPVDHAGRAEQLEIQLSRAGRQDAENRESRRQARHHMDRGAAGQLCAGEVGEPEGTACSITEHT